jgi:hypothetical protein
MIMKGQVTLLIAGLLEAGQWLQAFMHHRIVRALSEGEPDEAFADIRSPVDVNCRLGRVLCCLDPLFSSRLLTKVGQLTQVSYLS